MLNNGRQSYYEFLAMVRWQPTERSSILCQLCAVQAYGELNDYSRFFGNLPTRSLVRASTVRSYRTRKIVTSSGLSLVCRTSLTFVPILDVHTGFPFSRLDLNWNYTRF